MSEETHNSNFKTVKPFVHVGLICIYTETSMHYLVSDIENGDLSPPPVHTELKLLQPETEVYLKLYL